MLATTFTAGAAAELSRIEDPEVRACLARSLPSRDLSQRISIDVIDRVGAVNRTSGSLRWKRFDDGLSRVLVRIDEPTRSAGLGVLMFEREGRDPDVHMYVPELRRTRRMTSAALGGRMLGTDFSYEDFAHFQHIASSGKQRRLDDTKLEDHEAFVLETLPDDDESSSYSRIVTYIDRQWCLPLRTDFFALNGDLHKALVVERAAVLHIGDRYIPQRAVMFDHKQDSRSVIELTDIEIDTGLRDTIFSLAELGKGY